MDHGRCFAGPSHCIDKGRPRIVVDNGLLLGCESEGTRDGA